MLQQIENGEILQTDACVKLYSGTLTDKRTWATQDEFQKGHESPHFCSQNAKTSYLPNIQISFLLLFKLFLKFGQGAGSWFAVGSTGPPGFSESGEGEVLGSTKMGAPKPFKTTTRFWPF